MYNCITYYPTLLVLLSFYVGFALIITLLIYYLTYLIPYLAYYITYIFYLFTTLLYFLFPYLPYLPYVTPYFTYLLPSFNIITFPYLLYNFPTLVIYYLPLLICCIASVLFFISFPYMLRDLTNFAYLPPYCIYFNYLIPLTFTCLSTFSLVLKNESH